MAGESGTAARATSDGSVDVPTLKAMVAQLEGELDTLAVSFDRWWFAPPADAVSDLQKGAHLHVEIATRLGPLQAVRAALAAAGDVVTPTSTSVA